ncbi:hypothetical protein [Angustibacter peucedani]
MHAEVLQESRAIDGTRLTCPPAGAQSFTVLLAELGGVGDAPLVECIYDEGGFRINGPVPWFERNMVVIEPGQEHVFRVFGQVSNARLVRWRLSLEVDVDGEILQINVPEGSATFGTTGMPTGGFERKLDWAWYAAPNEPGGFQPEPTYD